MSAATLAPIAAAPATPPRSALATDLFNISPMVGGGFFVSLDDDILYCFFYYTSSGRVNGRTNQRQ
jgi:hypothetical protein